MTDPTEKENTTKTLLQDLLQKVSSLQQEVSDLKKNDNTRSRKRPRDGDGLESQLINIMTTILMRGAIATQNRRYDTGTTGSFSLSEEGEAFFETIFSERMEYATRKAKVAKYGLPDSRCTKCPQLDLVVEGILSPEALMQDKVAYRSQEMWLEAAGPLAAILEGASEGNLTLPEAIPMIQASLVLMGDASLHQSTLR